MDNSIDITGIDKGILLYSLWKGQVAASFFESNSVSPPDFNEEQANRVAKTDTLIIIAGVQLKQIFRKILWILGSMIEMQERENFKELSKKLESE